MNDNALSCEGPPSRFFKNDPAPTQGNGQQVPVLVDEVPASPMVCVGSYFIDDVIELEQQVWLQQ